MRSILFLLFVLIGVTLISDNASAELTVGDDAPAWKLVGSDGKTYSSNDLKGKSAYVIAWFPRAFTGGCTKECKSLRENGEAIRKFDVAYFTASTDPEEKNRDFAKSLELDYPILSDPGKKVADAFGCLNARGSASRWTFYVGKDGKVLHVDKKVKAAAHGSDIADKLESLGIDHK
ncbi:MAG: redoxin domain-containing protein [Planctomycetota bacterium]